jgi:MazG family protein
LKEAGGAQVLRKACEWRQPRHRVEAHIGYHIHLEKVLHKKRSMAGRTVLKRKKRGAQGKSRAPRQLSAGRWFEKLVNVQVRLRGAGGCPWDREQTHASLRTYLIEEAYEVIDALENCDDRKFAEELGDVLLQVVFHSQIASEAGRFDVKDVIRAIHDKMVRRHPHVFGKGQAKDSAEVLKNWEQLKAEERKNEAEAKSDAEHPRSLLDGLPKGLPATLQGFQLTRRAARIGFDWESAQGVAGKIKEEIAELQAAMERAQPSEIEEELGDLLFAGVNMARFLGVDPEVSLRNANAKFMRRFKEMERQARSDGQELSKIPRAAMERLWNKAKKAEQRGITRASGQSPHIRVEAASRK